MISPVTATTSVQIQTTSSPNPYSRFKIDSRALKDPLRITGMNVEFVRVFRNLHIYASMITAEPSDVFIFGRNALHYRADKMIFDRIIGIVNNMPDFKDKYRKVSMI